MSDREVLESMFRRRGICFEPADRMVVLTVDPEDMTDCNGKVRGYVNFSTEFHFNDAGDLTEVRIWE